MSESKPKYEYLKPLVQSVRVLQLQDPLMNGCIIDEIDKELRNRHVIVPRESILNVLDSFTQHYRHDRKVIPLMTINYIERYVKDTIEMARNNHANFSAWSATTERESHGLQAHPQIKLRMRKLNPSFHMNY
jgi:hypothetical protein